MFRVERPTRNIGQTDFGQIEFFLLRPVKFHHAGANFIKSFRRRKSNFLSGNHVQVVEKNLRNVFFTDLSKKFRSSSMRLIRVSPNIGNGTVVAFTTIRADEKEERNMRTISLLKSLALSLVLGLSISSGVWAQDDLTRGELRNFHEFLESHPRVAQDLRNNPSLANDRRWVSRHDELNDFLKDNPRIRRELRQNPNTVMTWERNFNARADLRKFDRFLDSHPRVAERLRANPELLRDRQFVQNNAELQVFLRENPDMRRELQAQPHAFMERVTRYDRYSRR